ncbi:tyrosinase family protein [Mesorhizobium sp. YC-39]|uniref:tyrosinase family protein n=1 Tax=unclassified Mesorhizobium TaxID=325217 RepID=UPI0021E8145A|nr:MULTISPECIES: tyrosinase family protein [unclassified Mesorhizobium]MCV3208830.1 tyrosinase family protein [Mesorhizobium sp. YC-2]MCV3231821.1 tyrosinase family protein [Mesorhizobium sp. YC-39]
MTCRRNQATLSSTERQAFTAAVVALKKAPSQLGEASRYDDFVREHVDSMASGAGWAHRGPAFGPWHREYLRRFELELQKINPNVTLPYWDWTVDNSPDPNQAGSPWTADFMGGDGDGSSIVTTGPFRHAAGDWDLNINTDGTGPELRRKFGDGAGTLPLPSEVANCLLESPYDSSLWNLGASPSFRDRLEGWHGLGSIHNRVHLWVGGSMLPESSPNDPIFWLHHCNVDRLWALWQRDHPGGTNYRPRGISGETGPAGHNLNDSMQPWGGATTVASTLDHRSMGYWYDTDPAEITLATPSLSFKDVPEGIGGAGRTTYRAVVFEVRSCMPTAFEIVAGPSGGFTTTALGTSVNVPSNPGNGPAYGRLWIAYTSTNPGDVANGSVTVAETGTANQWVIPITANTIARPKSAVVFALDRSWSMTGNAGDGTTKNQKLKESLGVFVETMLEGDGIGIVSYDDVVGRLFDVIDAGPQPPVAGSGRDKAAAVIAGNDLDPRGNTAIGAALVEAQSAIDDAQQAASPPYDKTAIVVLTDGIENVPPMIGSVMGSITSPTYAVGLGLPNEISVSALDALAQATGKYLLITGTLNQDQRFRLSKYFLQILAGVTGADIIVDPTGDLVFGPTVRIPFDVTDADYGTDAIIVSSLAQAIDFRLEAPDGTILDPSAVAGYGEWVVRRNVAYYRLPLPFGGPGSAIHGGRWHAVLTLDKGLVKKLLSDDKRREELLQELRTGGVPYSFIANAYSTLSFGATCQPGNVDPGKAARVSAALTEYGVPVDGRAKVWVDVIAPNGGGGTVVLVETEPGVFSGDIGTHLPGLYALRCRARGTTLYGLPFTREVTLSLSALGQKGQPVPGEQPWGNRAETEGTLLDLIECLIGHVKGEPFGIPAEQIRECLKKVRSARRVKSIKKTDATPGAAAMALKTTPKTPKIVTLAEAEPVPPPPPDHDHEGPMFGLSPEDRALGEEKRARVVAEEMRTIEAASKRKNAKRGRRAHGHGGDQ